VTEDGGGRRRGGLGPARPAAAAPPSEPRPATPSEQKLNRYRERRDEVLHPERDGEGGPSRHDRVGPAARERIEALLDPASFVELDMFATARTTGQPRSRRAPGAGVVVGSGTIDGRDVAVYAFEPAALGGSMGEVTAEKIGKVQELALRSRLPIIGLHDSGGARIEEGVVALAGYAEVLSRTVRSSGVVPQLSVICGPGTGRVVSAAALTDFVIATSGAGSAVAGELGGGVHLLGEDEAGCWLAVRRLLSYLPAHCGETPPFVPTTDPSDRADAELQALALDAGDRRHDMREVIARLLDDRQFLEVQSFHASNVVVGLGRLGGHSVGVVANQPTVLAGAIDADAAVKAARFVRFCDAFDIPLVSLVDSPGLLPSGAEEPGGLTRHGAQLLYAYAEASVPKLAVITGRDDGGAYLAMSPKQVGTDLNLAWPNAEIAAARDPETAADGTSGLAGPYGAAERGHVDDVIEPRETRRALIRGLELCLRKTVDRSPRKHGNIPL
jgi:propionyl-CoA carboxylase beta chain